MLRRELEDGRIALTAVYLKLDAEYFGFIEELPGMNSRGRTLYDAREALQGLAAEVFAEERRTVADAHTASIMVREPFFLKAPQTAVTAQVFLNTLQ
jgi:predicted RNase H-like HicB family nuclease